MSRLAESPRGAEDDADAEAGGSAPRTPLGSLGCGTP